MSTMTPGLRKALIAGGIVVVLSGGGVAAVWAAGQIIPSYVLSATPTGTASPATPSPGNAKHFPLLPRAFAGPEVHGEFTVKNKDGTFTTMVTQRGAVQSVSDSNISVKSDDGFTQSYAISSSTSIVKIASPATGTQSRRPSPQTIKATDLKAGDTVAVSGTKSGTTVTANRIIAGTLPAMLDGGGRRLGHGGIA